MLENPECSGTERNGTEPEVIVVQYECGCWTCGQKFALIRTVCFCVWTLISCSVLNSYEDGTSTNREPRQAYKTAEVGYSQLWAQSWVMLAYVLLDRTGNGFHIKISVMLIASSPGSSQILSRSCGEKSGEGPGIKTTSRTGNGGLGQS